MKKTIDIITSLFVSVVMMDPADNILKLKIPLFILLFLLLLFKHKYISATAVRIIIIIYSICLITNVLGLLRGIDTDVNFALSIYKGFLMILLLLWTNEIKIIQYLNFPTVLISFIVVLIFIFMKFFPEINNLTYLYVDNYDLPIKIANRTFIGVDLLSVFYKTSPLCIFVAGVYLQKLMKNEGNRFTNFFMYTCAISVLIISGTRMNILSAFVITGFIIIMKTWNSHYGKFIAGIISFVGFIAILIIINMLINDRGEHSLEIKQTLSLAFQQQVFKDPLLLLIGEGPGATFDSLGIRGKNEVISELTYLDLIRWFGVPFTVIIILIYLYPVARIYKKRKKLNLSSVLTISYFLYLLIAGTNPILISSTGMLALLIMYTYAFNPTYESKESIVIE